MISIKFVNDMVKLKRETCSLDPTPQGRRGHGKLIHVADGVRKQMAEHPATTLNKSRVAQEHEHGIRVHRLSVGFLLNRLEVSYKKDLRASEQKWPDVARDRAVWKTRRQPLMRDQRGRSGFLRNPERKG